MKEGPQMANFKFDGRELKDSHSNVIGKVDGNYIKDVHSNTVGRIDGDDIKDSHSNLIARIRGNDIQDTHGSRIATMDVVRSAIEGPGGTTLAALWVCFVR